MRQRSVMKHTFSEVPRAEIPRSKFDRSHGRKQTINAGFLYPIYVDEVVPGDTFNLRTSGFCRLATPIYPIMDNMFMETHYFAVPKRLVWDNWQKMMGEQDNPGDSTDFVTPGVTVPAGGFLEGNMPDYMGVPPGIEHGFVNALPMRAYNLIYNEWYRDQNLAVSVPVPKDDGPDNPNNYYIRYRGKRHDYFTSALPWPQKGPGVEIPLGTSAPVVADPDGFPVAGEAAPGFEWFDGSNWIYTNLRTEGAGGTEAVWDTTLGVPDGPLTPRWSVEVGTGLITDLSTASAATVNSLRQAFQIQKMYERDARGGSRYTEIIKSHFGVTSPDARLQRPEYLGGGSTPVNIMPVTSTAETDPATTGRTLGDLSAVGTTSFNGHGFTKSFTEHCIVIGLVSVRADLTYQQGLNRMWSRQDRLDYYWPALSHIGEQAVLSKEIYADGTAADDDVFGYQERFAEYRYKPSEVCGLFRSTASTPLDAWHLSQEFATRPLLNEEFIRENPPVDRVIATPTEPHFICDFYHSLQCARPMPLFGVPGNIDRF